MSLLAMMLIMFGNQPAPVPTAPRAPVAKTWPYR